MYLTTEEDLRRAMETAFVHCRPGGLTLFAPDFSAEHSRGQGVPTQAVNRRVAGGMLRMGLAWGGMIWSMRVKTSVTIDERVLKAIDKATTRNRSRSRVIEDAAREFLARRARSAREARDLAILNESAAALNEEMEDVLAYQADL